jgi:uncharacterized protein (TIGR02996 family)
MSDERALLAAICAEPDEDTLRLAYADWLDEHANALPGRDPAEVHTRAAFIRLQIEAERAPSASKRTDLGNRAAALWRVHRTAWEADYHATGAPPYPEFHRGFIGRFRGRPADAVRFPAVAAVCPIEDVALDATNLSPLPSIDFSPMAACPALARVRRLDFRVIVPGFVETLLPSPYLTGLRALRMSWGYAPPGDAVAAASAHPVATGLRELWIDWARETALTPGQGLGALLSAEWPALETLCVARCEMGDQLIRALAADFSARGRHGLHVYDIRLTAAGLRAAVEAALPGQIRSLSLGCSTDVRTLVRGEDPHTSPPDARGLWIEGFGSDGDALVNWLAEAVPPGRFDRLGVVRSRQSLTRVGARALAAWPGLAHLKELDLSDNWIGDAGAKDLANSPHLDGLELLHVAHNDITKKGKDALKARFGRRVRVA